MLSLTKSEKCGHLVMLLCAAIIFCPCKSDASEHGKQSKKSANSQEGRSAIHFYHNKAGKQTELESLRLSNKTVKYPFEPGQRLRPIVEWGDPFLGNGPIRPGYKTPTGQMIQPWFLLYGTLRSAFQSFEQGDHHTSEWTNRLDLNGNLNLSGTERLLFSMRPLDSQSGGYTGYSFEPNDTSGWHQDFNARLTKLYFEGDIGQIFPGLDRTDSHTYDIGFSVGRQLLKLQDGLLTNDIIDMVGITRNSLVFDGVSNLRVTGIYGWNHINRGNNDQVFNNNHHSANLFGLLSEADTAWNNTLALDLLYVSDNRDGNAWYVGASSTQRLGWLNSTFRVNASIPENKASQTVGSGVLLLSQLSTTIAHTDNILYFNTFWNIDRFTSAARSSDQGTPVANLGLLYGPVGMGRYGVALGQPIDNTIGTSLGYQMFLDGIDKQLIFEVGERTSTHNNRDRSAVGLGARYQQTFGKHHVLRLDSFVADQEGEGVSYGFRTEWMIKF